MSKIEMVLGIDVGGTNTVFGFVDKAGNCIMQESISTNAQEPAEKLFERLFAKVTEMETKAGEGYKVVGIGIGAPNANYYKGTVELPPNLNWGTVDIINIVRGYRNVPAAITNDANAAAIGEMQFGAAKGMKDFIVITLGTGLGSGVVVNGQMVYGHDGFAGELGHVIVAPGGRECGCGRKGCLEAYASASGIKRTVYELLCDDNDPSILRSIPFDKLTAKDIYDAAVKDDLIAIKAFEYTGEILGEALANFVAFTSPEAIILFGGLAAAGEVLFTPTRYSMEENMLNIFKGKTKLLPSALTDGNTAVLGAAALMWNDLAAAAH